MPAKFDWSRLSSLKRNDRMLKIERIEINGIGPIGAMTLDFDPHFNIICGPNGIGKTTILDCLAQSFAINQTSLKRSAGIDKGNWKIYLSIDNASHNRFFDITSFHPNETLHSSVNGHGFFQNANETIVFRTHRDIPYAALGAINVDPQKNEHSFAQETISGSLPHDLKNWFVSRHLWSKHDNHLDEAQQKNIRLAKICFRLLDPKIRFSKVVPASNEILLMTPQGEIYFEYLSSGYKSSLGVLLGLIKEIEFRYKHPSKYVRDFNGVVFIDEIDLHLHPEWQAKIYAALKKILPRAQIFTSTHSPHLIQVAQPSEIIALIRDSNGAIVRNQILNSEYGCQGWTVEEILNDVMGMSETRTDVYLSAMQGINKALENEDIDAAKRYLATIEKMLHPENLMIKILRIQLAGVGRDD